MTHGDCFAPWWRFECAPMDYTQSPDWYAGPV